MCPILDAEEYLDRFIELTTVNGILPVGFPTSPQISNACLFDFDSKLYLYCQNKGLTFTRYSDDIIVSGPARESLADIQEEITRLLLESFNDKLKVNESKSKFTHIGNKVKLLGMVIMPNKRVTVDIKFKKDLEVML
ncbi:reverse transcriptase domain-containing protein, partial [Azotobacter chroococcum]|nr:reverse transcriptase domain-containing protein [Azotobacter chroococcum]